MKVVVTGVRGQLGYDVMLELNARGHEALGIDIDELDITDADAVAAFFERCRPDVLIHCAAYTATDKAEDEPDVCRRVNADGTKNLALACRRVNARMLYISTDYVFDGKGSEPFSVDSPIAPLSVYGKTKYEGEAYVRELLDEYYIVRISWVFGINGKNFIRTMLRLAEDRDTVSVVCDQIGSPTYTKDLAPLLCNMAESDRYGTYHATNEGYCSWYELAEETFSAAGISMNVEPITSDKFPAKIKRPENSRLDKSTLDGNGFSRLPHWKDAVRRYVAELKAQQ